MSLSANFAGAVFRAAISFRMFFAERTHSAVQFLGRLAQRVIPSLGSTPCDFGPDYRTAHTELPSGPDAPYAALEAAEGLFGAPNIEALTGSSGVINIGLLGHARGDSVLALRYKWLVSLRRVPSALRASHVLAPPLTLAADACSQGVSLSPQSSNHDTATIIDMRALASLPEVSLAPPPPTHVCFCRRAATDACSLMLVPQDEFRAHLADLLVFFASVKNSLSIEAITIVEWFMEHPMKPILLPTTATVPVNQVQWFLTEAQEAMLVLDGITETPSDQVLADAVELHTFLVGQAIPRIQLQVRRDCPDILGIAQYSWDCPDILEIAPVFMGLFQTF
jgi:hypothetical protein